MNRWGEDILPEEVALRHGGQDHRQHRQRRLCGGRGGGLLRLPPAGRHGWILPTCGSRSTMAARWQCRWSGGYAASATPCGIWMGLRGFGHDDAVMADFVLLNDPTADTTAQ